MPSKCVCCKINPKSETSSHLFLLFESGAYVWMKLQQLLLIHATSQSFSSLLLLWWSKHEISTFCEWLKVVLPAAALWHIWKARNIAIFEEEEMNGDAIMANIKRYVHTLFVAQQINLPAGNISASSLEYFGLFGASKPVTHQLACWIPPKNN